MLSRRSDSRLNRREFVERSFTTGAGLVLGTAATGCVASETKAPADSASQPPASRKAVSLDTTPPDALFEKPVAELRDAMQKGSLTSTALTERYLRRIEAVDKRGATVNAVIEVNPDALAIARERDAERRSGRVRGPLHGIPILIKDNIDTADRMRTSAGSLALAASTPAQDAFIVQRLRDAGAVLLGKTNLSEWANFRSTKSSSGWSARGGQTHNPYVLDRNPCGSSSGTGAAIAADLAAIGIGTETDGSIICPSAANGLVGLKPTVGLWGRSGIIPISASQDTAGPMARTVADCAVLLGALIGVDPRDPATNASNGRTEADYTTFLDPAGLKDAHIGVARNLAGFNTKVDEALDQAIAAMRSAGAIIVDHADLAGVNDFGDAELDVLLYEFKDGLNAYLAALGATAPVRTLAELIAFNERERAREMPWFGQELFERAEEKGPLTETKYKAARTKCVRLTRALGIDATLAKHKLDAIVFPSNQPAWPTDYLNGDHYVGGNTSFAAIAGYPSITVPMGFVHELPVGLSFAGPAWSEGRLLRYAYAFEQQTKARHPPKYLNTFV